MISIGKRVKLVTPTIHTGKLRTHGRIVYDEFSPTFKRTLAIVSKRVWVSCRGILKDVWDVLKYTIMFIALLTGSIGIMSLLSQVFAGVPPLLVVPIMGIGVVLVVALMVVVWLWWATSDPYSYATQQRKWGKWR